MWWQWIMDVFRKAWKNLHFLVINSCMFVPLFWLLLEFFPLRWKRSICLSSLLTTSSEDELVGRRSAFGNLMSNYLREVIPLSQMVGTYYLLSNAAGIAQHFKSCGRKMRRMGSDRRTEWLTGTHTQPSCSHFIWNQDNECVPPLIRDGEEQLDS